MAFLGQTLTQTIYRKMKAMASFGYPCGDYQVAITEASLQDTKKRHRAVYQTKMDIVLPTHQGRILFSMNLNILNQSQKPSKLVCKQFGDVIRAIGLSSVQDTDQLIGGQLTVKVSGSRRR